MTEEVGLLQRMATRLSLRKVKKEQGVKPEKVDGKEEKEEEEKEMKEESDVVKNGEQESGLHNDTKVGGKEPTNEVPTNGGKVTEKGKKKKAKNAKKEDENEKEGERNEEEEEGVMQRLKSRLSMRGKKKDKVTNTSDQKKECNGTNKDADKEEKAEKKKEVEEEPVVEEKKWVSGSKEKDAKKVEEGEGKETEKEEKKKSDNAFLRMLRKLSFRKKKKKGNTENESGVEEEDKGGKELEKTLDEANTGNNGDKLVEKRFEERETRPQSLVMSSGRPPPGPGRPPIHPRTTTTPSSATANVSRPVSDLDSALRQFKLSTAESRESLRTLGSRQDLTQVEERVREAVGKSLSRQGSLRRGASGSTSIPITLSVSLQELRANQ